VHEGARAHDSRLVRRGDGVTRDVRLRVDGLYRYLVKSCGGTSLGTATVGPRGIVGDRQWMVVDETGEFLTQREHHRMALVRPRLRDDGLLELSAPGMPPLTVTPAVRGDRVDVSIWSDRCGAIDEGPSAAEWLSAFLEVRCRLVRFPDDATRRVDPAYASPNDQVGFADGFSFLLASCASLDDLNRRLAAPLPMNRFRPNIVVSGGAAFAEDQWKRIRIDGITFAVVKPCARCVTTTVDQQTGEAAREPLRTLATFRNVPGRGVMFGQNLIHDQSGVLQVGAEVTVLE
jgi:MOSC domain-containing protein